MILSREQLIERIPSLPRTVVLANGAFDLLHAGHIQYLTRAKQFGATLVVGVNTDEGVERYKRKPIIPPADRMTMLAALRVVDIVTPFDEPTAAELVALVRPDIYIMGGDYLVTPEGDMTKRYGGMTVRLPRSPHSTTDIIHRVRSRA